MSASSLAIHAVHSLAFVAELVSTLLCIQAVGMWFLRWHRLISLPDEGALDFEGVREDEALRRERWAYWAISLTTFAGSLYALATTLNVSQVFSELSNGEASLVTWLAVVSSVSTWLAGIVIGWWWRHHSKCTLIDYGLLQFYLVRLWLLTANDASHASTSLQSFLLNVAYRVVVIYSAVGVVRALNSETPFTWRWWFEYADGVNDADSDADDDDDDADAGVSARQPIQWSLSAITALLLVVLKLWQEYRRWQERLGLGWMLRWLSWANWLVVLVSSPWIYAWLMSGDQDLLPQEYWLWPWQWTWVCGWWLTVERWFGVAVCLVASTWNAATVNDDDVETWMTIFPSW